MAASKILLLLAVGLLIGGAVASFGAFKEFRRTSSQGQGGGRTEWALPVVLLDFVAAVLIIISQLSDFSIFNFTLRPTIMREISSSETEST